MDILAVQQRVLDAGLSFREYANRVGCIVDINEHRKVLFRQRAGVRHDAWKHVAEWLDKREAGE